MALSDDDERTRVTRAADTAADDLDERTVVSRGGAPSDLDDRTVVTRGADTSDLDERTVVSRGRVEQVDERTVVSRGAGVSELTEGTVRAPRRAKGADRGASSAPGAPGRLSGGRVAFVPTGGVERYSVNQAAPTLDRVERTVYTPPVVASRSAPEIAPEAPRRYGNDAVFAVIGVTVLVVSVVVLVVTKLLTS